MRACGLPPNKILPRLDSCKMADDKEHEDEQSDEESPETHENDEQMTNGEEDDSEFDDPEGFVDDITDEGKL